MPKFVVKFLANSKSYTLGRQYFTGFESINEFRQFYIVSQNYLNSSRQVLSKERVIAGYFSHKGFMYGKNPVYKNENTNHRAYPAFQFEKTALGVLTGAVLIQFWVYSDIVLNNNEESNWFSLATFSSYADTYWYRSFLINVNAKSIMYLMHVPENDQEIHDIYQTNSVKFPLNKWVKVTAYIDYASNNRFKSPFAAVWQDDNLVSAARFNNRINPFAAGVIKNPPTCLLGFPASGTIEQAEEICSLRFINGLAQAHFGLYAPPLLNSGNIFNDDLSVTEVLIAPRQTR
jgi:hypothetical protein